MKRLAGVSDFSKHVQLEEPGSWGSVGRNTSLVLVLDFCVCLELGELVSFFLGFVSLQEWSRRMESHLESVFFFPQQVCFRGSGST